MSILIMLNYDKIKSSTVDLLPQLFEIFAQYIKGSSNFMDYWNFFLINKHVLHFI